MKGGVRLSIAGLALLLALAGCGRGWLQYGERAQWRHDAEVACLKSGSVKLGDGAVQIKPIEGPGICGADFPLKVSALGESNPVPMSYADDLRPPAAIPNGNMPRWPSSAPRPAPPPSAPIEVAPGERMRWVPGPPPAAQAPQSSPPSGGPMSLTPPGVAPPPEETPAEAEEPDDIPDDAVRPEERARPEPPRTRPAYIAPAPQPAPPLGPAREPATTAEIPQATLKPAATLACPIVSALDRWVSEGVQPAAMHWFHSPVVEIHQISAYSCRGMVGSGTSHISEHAFGNALDIAGFTLADGRKITVKDGWHGTAEEQGFLHDVQLYACETFVTVLAPGYNKYHYNHIHVDLMRRRPGYRPCRPTAVRGEVVAARVRAHYAARHGLSYTGSIGEAKEIDAQPGEDGYVEDDDDAPTGSVAKAAEKPKQSGSFTDAITRWLRGQS